MAPNGTPRAVFARLTHPRLRAPIRGAAAACARASSLVVDPDLASGGNGLGRDEDHVLAHLAPIELRLAVARPVRRDDTCWRSSHGAGRNTGHSSSRALGERLWLAYDAQQRGTLNGQFSLAPSTTTWVPTSCLLT